MSRKERETAPDTAPFSHLCDQSACRQEQGEGLSQIGVGFIGALAGVSDSKVKNRLLRELVDRYVLLERRVDSLLKNTLPEKVVEEIKFESAFRARPYHCSILFSDFVAFTHVAEQLDPALLVSVLDDLFRGFDNLLLGVKGTKIKTMGDAYMAVFGAPEPFEDHPVRAVRAGLALQQFVSEFNSRQNHHLRMRVGIHSGTVVAGVVGSERMQFDVFRDNVNIAARFEASGEPGRVNISEATYAAVRDRFLCLPRGEIPLKNKASMKAYFIEGEI